MHPLCHRGGLDIFPGGIFRKCVSGLIFGKACGVGDV